jgi:adenosylhomocysteine nucleosidase
MNKPAILLIMMSLLIACGRQADVVVIISANAEWKAFKEIVQSENPEYHTSPYGQYFRKRYGKNTVVFFHGGWGKIDAAGSAQYVIDTFNPGLIVNIGTAGGFHGAVNKSDIILVDKTITYDIHERMGDSEEAIAYYSTDLECPDIKMDGTIRKSAMVSADQDLDPLRILELRKRYNAIAGDWESSAIAHVAKKNNTRCYILRGITDIVDKTGSEAYGNIKSFEEESRVLTKKLISLLEGEGILNRVNTGSGKL